MDNSIIGRHIFLSGDIGSGKSTLLQKLIIELSENQKQNICGFYTQKVKHENFCNIYIHNAQTELKNRFFTQANLVGITSANSRIGYENIFDSVGTSFLFSNKQNPIFIMDEIGFLESNAQIFTNKIQELLDTNFTILGVCKPINSIHIKNIANHPKSEIYYVNSQNRDTLLYKILRRSI